ncbi:MAG: DUF2752 domain-containing protein [Bacillota bacterium]|nr:DUF2752 domain-containing protein [Bacillota bacterium]
MKNNIKITYNKMALLIIVILGIASCGACIYLYYHSPFEKNIFPICLFRTIFHLYCPGCGATRATYELIHGNILKALRFNLLYVLSIPFMVYLTLSVIEIKINDKLLLPSIYFSKFGVIMMCVVILIFCILRNIPIYPFTLLAPP